MWDPTNTILDEQLLKYEREEPPCVITAAGLTIQIDPPSPEAESSPESQESADQELLYYLFDDDSDDETEPPFPENEAAQDHEEELRRGQEALDDA